ncbi:MAG: hydrogenase small subunit [Candidatus Omnitrophota bacterium]
MAKEKDKVISQIPVIWLHASSCSGCSVSVLNSVSPKIKNLVVDEIVPQRKVNLLFQEVLMAASGKTALKILEDCEQAKPGSYILIVEGAVPVGGKGIFGTIGEDKQGQPRPMFELLKSMAKEAMAVIALGSCASFGGISAAYPNPTGCVSVLEFFSQQKINKPVINIPGCPPHPDWFMGTVVDVLLSGLPGKEYLDELARPKIFFSKLIHESCPRRADFDVGRFARNLSEKGCLYMLGCKGPTTYADCPVRKWNDSVSWCVESGTPCLGCCEPEFPDFNAPYYEKTIPSSVNEEQDSKKGEK